MKNGQLGDKAPKLNMQKNIDTVAANASFVESLGIPFLFVQAPVKMDADSTMLPDGVTDYNNANADEFLALLDEAGVETLDTRTELIKDGETLKQYFYNTDTHWNARGAFVAFGQIMNRLNSLLGGDLDLSMTDINNWEEQTYPQLFLGSRGKRVGKYYGGLDDFIVLLPKEKFEMSAAYPIKSLFRIGTFDETVIWSTYLDAEKSAFSQDSYMAYNGGNPATVKIVSKDAKNKKKVLIIKDSFGNPISCFLSTEFTEVDVIDPRYYSYSTIAEYISMTKPDAVIEVIMIGDTYGSTFFNWGA